MARAGGDAVREPAQVVVGGHDLLLELAAPCSVQRRTPSDALLSSMSGNQVEMGELVPLCASHTAEAEMPGAP